MKRRRIAIAALGALLWLASSATAQQPNKKAVKLPAGTEQHIDQEYVANGHARQRLDLFVPKATGPLPIIVWIHGGAWLAGDKNNPPALPFLEKGYAVASINYRLSQHAVFPAQIEDCKAAIRWLRANAKKHNLDADHIGVWGASAGGHLVALLGTTGEAKSLEGKGDHLDQSSRVQCVVDFFGPTDLTKMAGSHDNPDSPESKLIGGAIQRNKEKAGKANPIAYIGKNAAPFLILHGDKDGVVPISQSELLADALKKAGVEVAFVPIPGAGHGGPQFQSPENRRRIEQFFDKHLRGMTKHE